jgi:hypothetical protein
MGIDALPSQLFLLASKQDGDLAAGAGALTRISKIRAMAIAEAERQLCDRFTGLPPVASGSGGRTGLETK